MTPFEKTEEIIENANEEKLQLILSKLETSDKVTAEEKIKLKEYIEVRRQILWFDELPDIVTTIKPTIYTHWAKDVPKQFQKPLSVCIKKDCKYCKPKIKN